MALERLEGRPTGRGPLLAAAPAAGLALAAAVVLLAMVNAFSGAMSG